MDYLVKHQYIDPQTANLKRKDLHLAQSLPDATLRHLVTSNTGVNNAFSFNCVGSPEVVLDEQFTAFKHILQTETAPAYRKELEGLLYPLFCHVYLEMISSGQKNPAHRFMSKHQGLFQEKSIERSMVETLQVIFSIYDIYQKEEVRNLRESKFCVSISTSGLEYLMRYLKSEDHTGLLYLLERFVDFNVVVDQSESSFVDQSESSSVEETNKKRMKENREKLDDLATDALNFPSVISDPSTNGSFSSSGPEPSMAALKEVMALVRDLPPVPPAIRLFRVTRGKTHLPDVTAADLTLKGNALALACEDSSIQLFPTGSQSVFCGGQPTCHRRIKLQCDSSREEIAPPVGEANRVFRGHSACVSDVSFFPDPNFFISSSQDKTVRLWNVSQSSDVAVYKGHNYQVLTVTTSSAADSGYFVSGSLDRTCRLWTTDRLFPLRTLVGHNLAVETVRFHPNQTYFATGSADKTVRLWTINDGKFVRLFQGHRAGIYALAFSPNGQYLASAGEDRRIRIWDIAQGTSLKEFKGHVDVVTSLCFSPDSSMLASGSQDGSIRIFDLSKGFAAANSQLEHPSDLLAVHYPSSSSVSSTSSSSSSSTSSSSTSSSSTSSSSSPSGPAVVHHLAFGESNTLYAVAATLEHQQQPKPTQPLHSKIH